MMFRFKAAILILCAVVACAERPETIENDTAPSLNASETKIFRDEWGVPHIYATTEVGGFFGLGYAMAEDQLERLLLNFLHARGELAANVTPDDLPTHLRGPLSNVETMIESDYQSKLWRIVEFSEAAVDHLHPQLRKNYQALLAGISAFMNEHPERAPSWAPQDITLADLVAIPHAQTWQGYQGGVGMNDCRRGGVAIQTTAKARSYSNQWALMPKRTTTGGAILLSDPHPFGDGRYVYEYRLHAGDLHMAGYAYGPALLLGRNRYVGWAFTTGAPDVADCYEVETLNDQNNEFKFDGGTKTFDHHEIVIAIKGRDPVIIEAKYSDHNNLPSPVVAESPGKVYVVSTPYLTNLEGLHNSIYQMNKARNVDELKEAQGAGWLFSQNLMAADIYGDIFYIRVGMTPVRPDPEINWLLPVNGNDSAFAWRGIHSVDDLFSIKSPQVGYLQNNNVHPRAMDAPAPKEIAGLPEYILDDGTYAWEDPASRGLRAIEAFAKIGQMTKEDALTLAFDSVLVGSQRWIAMLEKVLSDDDPQTEGEYKVFLDSLLSFNGALESSSTSALAYIYWREALRDQMRQHDIQPLLAALDDKEAFTSSLGEAFRDAAKVAFQQMQAAPKGLARTYGDEFRVGGGGGRSWPMSGGSIFPNYDPDVLNECLHDNVRLCPTSLLAMRYSDPDENSQRFVMGGSSIMRLDFYSPEGIESYSAQRPGISDVVASPHFDDQAEKLFSLNKLKPIYFKWSELKSNIRSTKTIEYTGVR